MQSSRWPSPNFLTVVDVNLGDWSCPWQPKVSIEPLVSGHSASMDLSQGTRRCPLNQSHLTLALRAFEGVYFVVLRHALSMNKPSLKGTDDTGLRDTEPHRAISFDMRQLPRCKHHTDRLDSQSEDVFRTFEHAPQTYRTTN